MVRISLIGVALIVSVSLSTAAGAQPASPVGGNLMSISVDRDSAGTTVPAARQRLHRAALLDDEALAVRLIDLGAPVDQRDEYGRTPLMVASAFGSLNVARVLVARGADAEAADRLGRYTPLHFAAGYGQVEMVDLLVFAGARLDVRAANGETALHLAALYGRLKAIDRLVGLGIDPNVADERGIRPIQYATLRLQGKAISLLRSVGARPDDLFDAVNAGAVARVQTLLAAGAEVNAPDMFGTPLHRAVASGWVYVANMLIDAGADLEEGGDPTQAHPLHLAALKNDAAMARLLIERGADVDARDGLGRTPLMVGLTSRSVLVVEVLLGSGADPTARDSAYGDAVIHYAARSTNTELMGLILAQGVDVNSRSGQSGDTALHYAASCAADAPMARLLVSVGANTEIANDAGQTPLELARSYAGAASVVDVLRDLTLR